MALFAELRLEPGSSIGGYEIVDELGRGAHGAVYRARQLKLDRDVAIKLISGDHPAASDDLSKRFLREVDLVRRLEHPNIVRLYDFGETDDGLLWMAMELVRGEELSAVLERERQLTPQRAHHITLQVLDALTEAHSLGIVHRDLKPANIMLTQKGAQNDVVKLLDFGVGKAFNESENPALQNLTGAGEGGYGTPRYMAPEYLKGEPVGPYTDIYAIGLILYEMLVGEAAVSGDRVLEILSRQLTRALALPSWLQGTRLGQALSCATAKTASERYPNALEFFRAIENIPREELAHIADARAGRAAPGAAPVLPLPSFDGAARAPAALKGAPPPLPGTITPTPTRHVPDDGLGSGYPIRLPSSGMPRAYFVVAAGFLLALAGGVAAMLDSAGRDEPTRAEASTDPTSTHDETSSDDETTETTETTDDSAAPDDGEAQMDFELEPGDTQDGANGEATADEASADEASADEAGGDGDAAQAEPDADAAAEVVAIEVHSTPGGASVYNGRERVCGATPCTVRLARDAGTTRLKFKLKGYHTGVATLDPGQDTQVRLTLDERGGGGSDDGDNGGFGKIKIP